MFKIKYGFKDRITGEDHLRGDRIELNDEKRIIELEQKGWIERINRVKKETENSEKSIKKIKAKQN